MRSARRLAGSSSAPALSLLDSAEAGAALSVQRRSRSPAGAQRGPWRVALAVALFSAVGLLALLVVVGVARGSSRSGAADDGLAPNGGGGDAYCQAEPPALPRPPSPGARLVRAALVARHGDRSPLAGFEGDGYGDAWAGRCPNGREGTACYKGQLTNRGAAQLRRNGASLRQALRSAGLAREPYTVEVHCTHIPRTMDSARALLEGLLGSRWAAGRVHVAQQHSGPALWLYPNREYCGALKARGGSVGAHLVGEEAADKAGFSKVGHWKLGEFFTNYTDQRVRLFDLYAARRCHQPGAGVYPCGEEGQCGFDELKSAATVAEVAQFLQAREEGWLQLVVGPLVDRLIVFLLGEGGSVPDFLYFSGHDTTLMPLLVALDLWERPPVGGEWPPYASTLLFSLWTTAEGADMVQLTYNGEPVELPACSYPCTTDKLRSALARLALKEEAWRGRCDAIEAKADAITQSVR